MTPIERFEEKYIPEPNSGCWLWTGAVCCWNRRGAATRSLRPTMMVDGKVQTVHRWAYKTFVGPIAEGLLVCHRCGVSLCVNPDHLYAATAKENAADMLRHGIHNSQLYPDAARERGKRMYEKYGSRMGTDASSRMRTIRAAERRRGGNDVR